MLLFPCPISCEGHNRLRRARLRSSGRRPRRATRPGFTALELILGLALTSFIGLCLIALASTSMDAWGERDRLTDDQTSTLRTRAYVERAIHIACDVGYVADGSGSEPATLLLWAGDRMSLGGAIEFDHAPQYYELILLRYDPTNQRVTLYRPRDWNQLTPAQQASAVLTVSRASLSTKETADAFRTADWVEQFDLLGNEQTQVAAVSFEVDRSFERPLVRYEFQLQRADGSSSTGGLVSLRAPDSSDVWLIDLAETAPMPPAESSGSGSGSGQ